MALDAMDEKTCFETDMFSLGATLFCLVNGSPPFCDGSGNLMVYFNNLMNFKGQFRIPSQYSNELKKLINWMLKIEVEQRFSIQQINFLKLTDNRLDFGLLRGNTELMEGTEPKFVFYV